jgi:hypothetical protein
VYTLALYLLHTEREEGEVRGFLFYHVNVFLAPHDPSKDGGKMLTVEAPMDVFLFCESFFFFLIGKPQKGPPSFMNAQGDKPK